MSSNSESVSLVSPTALTGPNDGAVQKDSSLPNLQNEKEESLQSGSAKISEPIPASQPLETPLQQLPLPLPPSGIPPPQQQTSSLPSPLGYPPSQPCTIWPSLFGHAHPQGYTTSPTLQGYEHQNPYEPYQHQPPPTSPLGYGPHSPVPGFYQQLQNGPYPPPPQLPVSPQFSVPQQLSRMPSPSHPGAQYYPQELPLYQQQISSEPIITGQYFAPPRVKSREYSPGYVPGERSLDYDPTANAALLQKATGRGVRCDLDIVTSVVFKLTPLQFETLKPNLYNTNVAELVDHCLFSSTAVKDGVQGLLLGPRDLDAWLIRRGLDSVEGKFSSRTTINWMLSLALLGRKDGDVESIRYAFERMYGSDKLLPALRDAFKKDRALGHLFENVFEGICNPGLSEVSDDEAQKCVVEAAINKEVDELFAATVGAVEPEKFAWIFGTSSAARLKNIMDAYDRKYNQRLKTTVKKKMKKYGTIRDGLLYILQGIEDEPRRDAKLLENTMKGLGTREVELSLRLVVLSWKKGHMTKVKSAYKAKYPERVSLIARIEGDTSGDMRKFLVSVAKCDED